MNRSDRTKRIIFIILAALASGYFMYTGFSLLYEKGDTPSSVMESAE
ncbi:hypothetical protein [Sulfurimonas sp. HSL3-7]